MHHADARVGGADHHASQHKSFLPKNSFFLAPIHLFLHISCVLAGGAAIQLSLHFPNQVRLPGRLLGSFHHWLMVAVIALPSPIAETPRRHHLSDFCA